MIAQLKKLKKQTQKRMENAKFLDEELQKIKEIKIILGDGKMDIHPRHLYIIRFLKKYFNKISKEKIVKALNAEGIPALTGYSFPLYKTPAFQNNNFGIINCQNNKKIYPQKINYNKVYHEKAELACQESIWLLHPLLLGSKTDMQNIIKAIKKVILSKKELLN